MERERRTEADRSAEAATLAGQLMADLRRTEHLYDAMTRNAIESRVNVRRTAENAVAWMKRQTTAR